MKYVSSVPLNVLKLNDEEYISQADTCLFLGISAYRLRRFEADGEIVSSRYGVRKLFKLDDVKKFQQKLNQLLPIEISNFKSGSYYL